MTGAWCTSQTTVISRWMGGEMVLKYTENGNVLETIRRFQLKAVSKQKRLLLPTFLFKLKPYWTYLLLLSIIIYLHGVLWFGNCFWNLLIVSRTLPVFVCFKTINTRSSTVKMKCGLGCAPTICRAVFCVLFHLSVPVLGFTYRKALEQ